MPRLVASPQAAATSHVADVTLEGGVRVSPPEQVATRGGDNAGGTMQAGHRPLMSPPPGDLVSW